MVNSKFGMVKRDGSEKCEVRRACGVGTRAWWSGGVWGRGLFGGGEGERGRMVWLVGWREYGASRSRACSEGGW